MANQPPRILPPAFEIDNRITVNIESELASALGRLILETDTKNTALLALGHQLRSLCHDACPTGRSDDLTTWTTGGK